MELQDTRKVLDDLDSIILTTLAARMSYIPQVAEYKQVHDLPRYQPERESEIFENRRHQAQTMGLDPNLAQDVMELIIKYAHQIESDYLGR